MAAHNKEIEIQVQVEKIKPLLEFLKKNAELIGKSSQIDRYFTPQHRNFLDKYPTEEWLRLRDAGGKFSVTYKKWKYDEKGHGLYADEYETIVKDIDQMESIFTSVDMKEVVTVHKLSRQTWLYDKYEIVIDKIKGLGTFVELEYSGKEKNTDHEKITSEMIKFLKDLGCGKITQNHNGYPYILLFPEKVHYEIY